MSQFNLRPWVKGNKFSASHLDESRVLLQAIAPLVGAGDIETLQGTKGRGIIVPFRNSFLDIRQGVIVDRGLDGSDDFFDERYFVKPVFSEPVGFVENLLFHPDMPAKGDDGEFQEPFPIVVTNLAEEKAHTHFLRTDGSKIITFFGYWDSENNKHWVMSEQPGHLLAIITNAGPEGEADFTDHRYWAKIARIENDSDSMDIENDYQIIQMPVGPDEPGGLSGPNPDYAGRKIDLIIMLENLGEKASGTHSLLTDETVIVPLFFQLDQTKDTDGNPTPQNRYWTVVGGGSSDVFIAKINAIHGANSNTANGTATTNYDLEDKVGTIIASGLTPVTKRPQGNLLLPAVGDYVLMFKDFDGNNKLWSAGEAKNMGDCTLP